MPPVGNSGESHYEGTLSLPRKNLTDLVDVAFVTNSTQSHRRSHWPVVLLLVAVFGAIGGLRPTARHDHENAEHSHTHAAHSHRHSHPHADIARIAVLTASHQHTHYTFFGVDLTIFDIMEVSSSVKTCLQKSDTHLYVLLRRILEIRSPSPPATVCLRLSGPPVTNESVARTLNGRDGDAPVPHPPPSFLAG